MARAKEKRKRNWPVALAAAKEAAQIGYHRPYRTVADTLRLNRLPPREQVDAINTGVPNRAERRARAIEKEKQRRSKTRRAIARNRREELRERLRQLQANISTHT